MSLTIVLETVNDVTVYQEGLKALIEKGYQEMNVTLSNNPNALQLAKEWDNKIDTAKRLLTEAQKQNT